MQVPRPENLASRMQAITNAGARAVLGQCSGSAVLGLESPSYGPTPDAPRRPQASRVRKCPGGRLDVATSLPALCVSLRGFAWPPTSRKVPLPHNRSTTDLRL